jgi:hypothetical protein
MMPAKKNLFMMRSFRFLAASSDDDATDHLRVNRTEVVECSWRVELVSEVFVGVEHRRLERLHRTDHVVRNVVAIRPRDRCAHGNRYGAGLDVESTDLHSVKPWFTGKLDFSPPVADLSSRGFPLVGGRLDYARGRPVAALIYQRHKHAINVFVSPGAKTAPGRAVASTLRGFNLRQWSDGGMFFCVVTDLNGAELDEFVRGLRSGQ